MLALHKNTAKGVVHPENDLFSIDYLSHGDLGPMIDFIFFTDNNLIIVNVPPLIADGEPKKYD